MNTRIILSALGVIIMAFAGCSKKSSTSSDTFSDSLVLGTGIGGNGFDIVGETTTFTGSPLIYWRLESKDDMGGSPVEVQITQSGTQIAAFSYQPAQN